MIVTTKDILDTKTVDKLAVMNGTIVITSDNGQKFEITENYPEGLKIRTIKGVVVINPVCANVICIQEVGV